MRLHVTIYSTNVDDDDMWESGSPRSGSGEAGVLAATIGSSPVAIATVVTSRLCVSPPQVHYTTRNACTALSVKVMMPSRNARLNLYMGIYEQLISA